MQIWTPLHSFWVELECTAHPNPTTVVGVGTECTYTGVDWGGTHSFQLHCQKVFSIDLTSHAARKNRGVACFSLLSMEERRKKERLLTSSVGLATYAFPHFPTKYNLENLLFKKLQR